MTTAGKLAAIARRKGAVRAALKQLDAQERAQEKVDRGRQEQDIGFAVMAELDALPPAERQQFADVIRKLLEKHISSAHEQSFLRIKGLAFCGQQAEPDLTKKAREI
jgi:hypothetical protein